MNRQDGKITCIKTHNYNHLTLGLVPDEDFLGNVDPPSKFSGTQQYLPIHILEMNCGLLGKVIPDTDEEPLFSQLTLIHYVVDGPLLGVELIDEFISLIEIVHIEVTVIGGQTKAILLEEVAQELCSFDHVSRFTHRNLLEVLS